MTKILIIRFSSIGDIIQCMSIVGGLRQKFPNAEIHWAIRSDMASLLRIDPRIDKIWEFERKKGIFDLVRFAVQLKKQKFTHIYDAHYNIRSRIVKLVICPSFGKTQLITRYKNRIKRLLLFKFGINMLPKPFKSFESFRKPLNKWEINWNTQPFSGWHFNKEVSDKVDQLLLPVKDKTWITLVPSATWELKRWPVEYWQKIIKLKPDLHFVIIAGPEDYFCNDIASVAPERVHNLAGKTSLFESFYLTFRSQYVISGDTGFLHAADLFEKPGQAIIGPTAFGFPTGVMMKIMEVDLPCRPCTKDGNVKCRLKEHKKCMMDITPEMVVIEMDRSIRPV